MSKRPKPDWVCIQFPIFEYGVQVLTYQSFNLLGETGKQEHWEVDAHSDLEPICRRITALVLMDLRRALEPD